MARKHAPKPDTIGQGYVIVNIPIRFEEGKPVGAWGKIAPEEATNIAKSLTQGELNILVHLAAVNEVVAMPDLIERMQRVYFMADGNISTAIEGLAARELIHLQSVKPRLVLYTLKGMDVILAFNKR